MPAFPLDLNAMYFFTKVVEYNGFSAAGRALGVPKSRLSRQIEHLEQQLGLRLLQRSSRRIAVTDVGSEFYRHSVAMMQQADAAHQAALRAKTEPRGTVRFGVAPLLADKIIARLLPHFMSEYPQVNVEVHVTPHQVNMLEEGLDFVIRGPGETPGPGDLIQRRLGTVRWLLVASPLFIARYGSPATVNHLRDYPCLLYPLSHETSGWSLYGPENQVTHVPLLPRLASDNLQIIFQAALKGEGICGLPLYACREAIAAGELQTILSGWHPHNGELVMLYPSRHGVPHAVKALMNFLCQKVPDTFNENAKDIG